MPSSPPSPRARAPLLFCALLLLHACSDDPPKPGKSDTIATEGETAGADTGLSDSTVFFGDVEVICPGGPSCACSENIDCDSQICVVTSAGKVCAQTCVDSCPTDFICSPYTGGGGDTTNICVPRHGRRCDPCTTNASCKAAGQPEARCVLYGVNGVDGSFCGSTCATDTECGAGYACKLSTDVDGGKTKQCVRDGEAGAASCPCGVLAGTQQLATSCKADKPAVDGPGTVKCPGTRRCTKVGADGLSACVASPPSAEICDLKDNDCNGTTDDPAKVCNDNNTCTFDKCDPKASEANQEGCVHTGLSGDPCDDGDICTAGDKCLSGACKPGDFQCDCKDNADCDKFNADKCKAPRICELSTHKCVTAGADVQCPASGKPCVDNTCQPLTGKCQGVLKADGVACTDGKPCTVKAECESGACSVKAKCECQKTADCAPLQSSNPCDGTLYCATDGPAASWKCKVNPASVLKCPADKDTTCLKSQCAAATNTCQATPQKNGIACEDGTVCTKSDACKSGKCVGGPSTCACKSNDDCALKDDGDLCNGTTYCDNVSGKCVINPATIVTCPITEDTYCRARVCDPVTGGCQLKARNKGKSCDDDNPCTKGETCEGIECAATPLANTCSCTNDGECAAQEDGNLCNGTLFCNKAAGKCEIKPASVVQCPTVDDTTCAAKKCQPKSGKCALQPQNSGFPCEDGSPCTKDDTCAQGACKGKGSCLCSSNDDCKKVDDSNACNGYLICDKGNCVLGQGTDVKCNAASDTPCRKNLCDPKTGVCAMTAVQIGHPCDDGNKCTTNDFCKPAGACEGAVDKKLCPCTKDSECDDGASCSIDLCDPSNGCVVLKIDAACDDGKPCTNDRCAPGAKDAAAKTGCRIEPFAKGLPCDDEESCTDKDVCDGAGACGGVDTCGACKSDADCVDVAKADLCAAQKVCVKGGAATGKCQTVADSKVTCSESVVPCVGNRCNSKTGACESAVIPGLEGKSCDDGTPCTKVSACKAGKCVGKSDCGCKVDADCASKEDGNACNGTLKCAVVGGVGECQVDPGTIVACDPRKDAACVKSQCDGKTGKCAPTFLNSGEPCDDGNPCTGSKASPDGCKSGSCVGGPSACPCLADGDCKDKGDGNPCTGTLACIGNKCAPKPGTVVQCSGDAGPCNALVCDSKDGKCRKIAAHDGWSCDDGEKCTSGDHCAAGACVAVAKVAGCCSSDAFCNDGIACTKDSCDGGTKDKAGKGCLNAPVHAACDDGNVCVVNTCAPLAKDAVAGCRAVTATDGAACDDGDVCTGTSGQPDGCAVGLCKAGTVVVCDDGDVCTTDSCDKAKGCKTAPVTCKDDGNACTTVACDKKQGCVASAVADGKPCALGADAGLCKAGKCEKKPAPVEPDYDHDGLVGAADPCPTVWNPDGDKSACPDYTGGMANSTALALTEPGQAEGMSKRRRTNEPVEVPLVNGIRDSSLVGYWPAGSGEDLSTHAATAPRGAADLVQGVFGGKEAGTKMNPTACVTALKRTAQRVRHGTVMTWFKLDKAQAKGGATQVLVRMQDAAKGDGSFRLLQADGTVQLDLKGANLLKGAATGLDTNWHHAAGTWDETTANLYLDGVLVASGKRTVATIAPDADLRLGCDENNQADNRLAGAMSDVLLFGRSLSPREIAVYAESKAPYGSSLVPGAQADFDDLRVTEATDLQQGEHHTHFEVIGARPHSDTDLNGVVAYWRFDGDGQNTVKGGPAAQYKGAATATGRLGDANGAVSTANGARVELPASIPPGLGATTYELWFSPQEAMTTKRRDLLMYHHNASGSYVVLVHESGKLNATFQVSGKQNITLSDSISFGAGRWYHVAVVQTEKGLVHIYVDGVRRDTAMVKSAGAALTVKPGGWWHMGEANGQNHLDASFDEIIVHNSGKSADYIAKRARGLPRVRFLAHTREKAEKSGFWKSHDYALRWGNAGAKAVATKVVGLDKKTACDGLLSPCLGYEGWWRLDDAGTSALDSTSRRQHGTVHGGATPIAARSLTGFSLDGKDDRVHIPHAAHFDLQRFSFEISANLGALTKFTHIAVGGGGGEPDNYSFQLQENAALWFRYEYFGTTDAFVPMKAAVKTGSWLDLAGTLDAKTMRLFVGGAEEGDKTRPGDPAYGKQGITVGAHPHTVNPPVHYPMGVDELRLMNRALTTDELLHFPLLTHAQKWTAPAKPGSCDDGNVCTIDTAVPGGTCVHDPATSVVCDLAGKSGVCGAGVCKEAAACPLFIKQTAVTEPDDWRAVLPMNDGGFVAAGNAKAKARLQRYDAAGKHVWTAFPRDGTGELLHDGVAFQGGFAIAGKLNDTFWIATVDSKGKMALSNSFGARTCHDLSVAPGGLICAGNAATTNDKARLVRTDDKLQQLWNKTWSFEPFQGVVPVGGDGFAVVSSTGGNQGGDLRLFRVGGAGEELWTKDIDGGGQEYANGLARSPLGGYVITCQTRQAGKPWDALIVRVDEQGGKRWQKAFGTAGNDDLGRAHGIAVRSDGGIAALVRQSVATSDPRVVRLDDAGNVLLDAKVALTGQNTAHALAWMEDGGFLLGVANGSKYDDSSLVRTDAFGNTDCAKSGVCAFAANACDDEDACTTDSCDAKTGCVHIPVKGCEKPENMDLDHDGLVGKADPCPTAWSPDGDKVRGNSSCAVWDAKGAGAAWTQTQSAGLHEPGLSAPWSSVRRTNEPVEIPLVNGISDASLIGHWKLDGDGKDASEHDHHGTVVGSPNFVPGPLQGQSMALDGKDDGILVGSGGKAPLDLRTSSLTVSMWFHATGKPNGYWLFGTFSDGNASSDAAQLRLDDASCKLSWWIGKTQASGGDGFCDGNWRHVAATWDAGTGQATLVVNGALVASKAAKLATAVHSVWAFGRADYTAGGWLQGGMDDIALFNRALSPQEIAVYAESKAPYGSSFVPNAQPDFDDLRVTEKTDVQPWEHNTHFELLGARPHSDTDLANVAAYWKLDGDGKDVLGKYDAAVNGAKATVGRFGDADGAMQLDGASELKVAATADMATLPAGTWEAWVRLDGCSTGKSQYIVVQYGPDGWRQLNVLNQSGKCALQFVTFGKAGAADVVSPPAALVGRWFHVAATWDTKDETLYVDGIPIASKPSKGTPKLGGAMHIGSVNGTKHFVTGAIDEVIVHNVAKSADYIAKRARGVPRVRFLAHTRAQASSNGAFKFHDYTLRWGNQAVKGPETRVISADGKSVCDALLSPCLGYAGWWRFDEVGVIDSAAGRHHGALKGTAQWVPGARGGALEVFGAKDTYAEVPAFDALNKTPLSVEAAVMSAKFDGDGGIVHHAETSSQEVSGWRLYSSGSGQFTFQSGHGSAYAQANTWTDWNNPPDHKLQAGAWFSVAGQLPAVPGKMSVWLRGEKLGDKTYPASTFVGTNSTLRIGWSHTTPSWHGAIDEVRIMNRALTADELLHFPLTRARLK